MQFVVLQDPHCSASLPLDILAGSDHTSYLGRVTGGDSCNPQSETP